MKKCLALLRVSFRGIIFSANPSSKATKKSASGIGFLALMSLLMLYTSRTFPWYTFVCPGKLKSVFVNASI